VVDIDKRANNSDADLPAGFKMTEMGPLPEEWEVVRLGEVVKKARSGGTPLRSKKEYWNGSIPFALIEDLTASGLYLYRTKESISEEGLRNSSAWIVPEGSILLSMYATIGATAVNKIPLATNQAILALVPTENLNAEFGALLLSYKADELARFNVQSTQKNINKGIVLRFFIPLPPLSEQRAIAHVLRTVQRAKEATERVIQTTRELKKSLMRYLFTYGPVLIEEAERVSFKETEIGLVPEHWEVVRLGEIFEIQQGKALSPKSRFGSRMRPFLRTANILWGRIDLSNVDYMHFEESEEQRLALRAGDLLVCEGGDIGRTAIWNGQIQPCYYQNHLHRLRPNCSDVEPTFYMYWMETAWTILRLYGGAGNKTTIPNLSQSRLSSFPIPFPSLSEQRTIARVLRTVDKKLQAEEARKQALEELFKTLLHNLMTGEIRVKDVVLPNVGEGKGDITN